VKPSGVVYLQKNLFTHVQIKSALQSWNSHDSFNDKIDDVQQSLSEMFKRRLKHQSVDFLVQMNDESFVGILETAPKKLKSAQQQKLKLHLYVCYVVDVIVQRLETKSLQVVGHNGGNSVIERFHLFRFGWIRKQVLLASLQKDVCDRRVILVHQC
jgi:hypothetical protein